MGKLLKENDDFAYMYMAERDVPMWKSLNVSEGVVHVQSTFAGQQSGGCRSEQGATVGDVGETRELPTMTR